MTTTIDTAERTCSDCGKAKVSRYLTTLCCACAIRAVMANGRSDGRPPGGEDDVGDRDRFGAREVSWR